MGVDSSPLLGAKGADQEGLIVYSSSSTILSAVTLIKIRAEVTEKCFHD